MKYTVDDIKKLGTILGVWAHPDDECWMSGGLMAAAMQNGQRVVCVTATHGESGQTADDPHRAHAKIGPTRQHELTTALKILGQPEHRLLTYSDGLLARTDPVQPIKDIVAILQEVKPNVIVTFGPDGFTGHLDHRTVYTWARQALRQSGLPASLWMATEATEKHQTSGKALHTFANFYCNTLQPFTVSANDVDVYFELPDSLLQKKGGCA